MLIERQAAADRIEKFARADTLTQWSGDYWEGFKAHCGHNWDGDERSNLLGAIDPEWGASQTHLMPTLLAEIAADLLGRLSIIAVKEYGIRLADALRRGDPSETMQRRFFAGIVEDAVQSAIIRGTRNDWPPILAGCNNVCAALRGKEGSEEAADALQALRVKAVRSDFPNGKWTSAEAEACTAAYFAGRQNHLAVHSVLSASHSAHRLQGPSRLLDLLLMEMLRPT